MVALKRRKTGGYAARKVIPKDVREDYAALYGTAWEEKLTIPAGTPPHEAKARHGEWLAIIETRISRLRAAKNGERQSLTRRDAQALAGEWYRWFIAQNERDLRPPGHWRKLSDTLVWDVNRLVARSLDGQRCSKPLMLSSLMQVRSRQKRPSPG
jgi:hypothetical protein